MFTHSSQLIPVVYFLIELYGHDRDLKEEIAAAKFKVGCVDNPKSITCTIYYTSDGHDYCIPFTLLHSDKAFKVESYVNDLMDCAFNVIEQNA